MARNLHEMLIEDMKGAELDRYIKWLTHQIGPARQAVTFFAQRAATFETQANKLEEKLKAAVEKFNSLDPALIADNGGTFKLVFLKEKADAKENLRIIEDASNDVKEYCEEIETLFVRIDDLVTRTVAARERAYAAADRMKGGTGAPAA